MRKNFILASLLLSSTTVFAQFVGNTTQQTQGGFSGPSISKTTVKHAKTLKDDMPVVLEGNIIQHLGKNNYLFRDATGDITIEIDHEKWNGLTVKPQDRVTISGETDKDWNSVEIEVDTLTK